MTWYDENFQNKVQKDFPAAWLTAAESAQVLSAPLPASIVSGMNRSPSRDADDLVVVDNDDSTKLSHLVSREDGYTRAKGMWFWYNNSAVRHASGAIDKTFVGFVDAKTGSVYVGEWDHNSSDAFTETLIEATTDIDDHNAPTIGILPNGKLITVWAGHNKTYLKYRISSNEGDSTAWESVVDLSSRLTLGTGKCSYPQVHVLEDVGDYGRVVITYREEDSGVDRDRHSIWGNLDSSYDLPAVGSLNKYRLIDGGGVRPYATFVNDGSRRIHAFTNVAGPGEVTDEDNHLFHFYWDHPADGLTGGTVHKSDGTTVTATLSVNSTDMTLVDTGGASTGTFPANAVIDSDGNPLCAYMRYPDPRDGTLQYMRARWTGSAWSVETVEANATSVDKAKGAYAAGIHIDPNDPDTVWCCKDVGGGGATSTLHTELRYDEDRNATGGFNNQLFKYTTSDSGTTWSSTQVSSKLGLETFYVICPRNAHSSLPWLANRGYYKNYKSGIVGSKSADDDFALSPHLITNLDLQSPTYRVLLKCDVDAGEVSGGKTVYIYAGNSQAADQSDPTNVWTAGGTVMYASHGGPHPTHSCIDKSTYSGKADFVHFVAATIDSNNATSDREYLLCNHESGKADMFIRNFDPSNANKAMLEINGDGTGGPQANDNLVGTGTVCVAGKQDTEGAGKIGEVWINGVKDTTTINPANAITNPDSDKLVTVGTRSSEAYAAQADLDGEVFLAVALYGALPSDDWISAVSLSLINDDTAGWGSLQNRSGDIGYTTGGSLGESLGEAL